MKNQKFYKIFSKKKTKSKIKLNRIYSKIHD